MRRRRNPKKKKVFRHIWLVVLSALLCFFVAVLLMTMLKPVETSFNVNVRTEKIEFLLRSGNPVTWVLEDAETTSDSTFLYNGLLELNDSVQVMIRRRALGELWINLRALNMSRIIGTLKTRSGEETGSLNNEADLFFRDFDERVKKGKTVVLSVLGEQFSLGRPSGKETTGSTELLLSGTVSMLDESTFRSTVFEAGSFELKTGDHFSLRATTSMNQGLIVADNTEAFRAIYRVKGEKGEITRPGGAQFTVSTSRLNKLFNDPFFKAISLMFSVVIVLVTIVSFIIDIKTYKSE